MNQTPLNPDALENAADIIWMNTRGENGVCDADRRTDDYATIEAITSVAIKEYLTVAHPVVNSFDPRDLNRRGWTCGCEPGDYDKCEGCQSACDELADFLNRPEEKS